MLEQQTSKTALEAPTNYGLQVEPCAEAADFAEHRALRQLVEALLFEGLVKYTAEPRAAFTAFDAFDAVYDRRLHFAIGSQEYTCCATVSSFSRVRVAHGSVKRVIGAQTRDARLAELLDALDVSGDAKARLCTELGQTLTLSRWNYHNLPHQHAPRRALGFQQLESAIVEGHLYHPSFKSRTGFSLRDHEKFGSEAGHYFQLEWLAIVRSHLRNALPDDEATFWRQELGDGVFTFLTQQLRLHGGSWQSHALVPIHPWQYTSILEWGMSHAISSGEIVTLGAAGDYYHASQSLRTLLNASQPTKANVKLPLNIVCTSSIRTLEPHFVCTAPLLSEWLVSLVARDPFLQNRQHLVLLREYAALVYEPRAKDTSTDARQSNQASEGVIGVIFRESVLGKLQPGEAAVPFTALMLVESDQRTFIADWLDHYGIDVWVSRLLEVMLIPLWHMLVHHGIAFEAHAQNLVLVHTRGWPQKIVLRDFHEDTEFVPDYLSRPDLAPDFTRVDPFFTNIPDDDGYRMASTDALRELFMDTVYVYNLADLSFLLRRLHGFDEEHFWALVRAQLDAYAKSGVTPPTRIDRIQSDAKQIVVESLLTKKIMDGGVLDYFEHTIENTLGS